MRSLLSVAVIAAMTSACVTTHTGDVVEGEGGRLAMSCDRRNDVDATYFRAYTCTLENKGATWLDVSVRDLQLLPAGGQAKLSTPNDILAFEDAYKHERAARKHNTDMALGVLALGGAALALGSGNETTAGAGALTAVSAVSVGAGIEAVDDYRKVQHGEATYSNEHLLAKTIRVPPGSYTRRTFLVEASDENAPTGFKVCLSSPSTDCYDLPIAKAERGK